MKRKLAWAWVVFTGLVMLMLTALIPFVHPLTWHAFGLYGKAMCSTGALMSPAVRYLRKNTREISGPE